MSVVGYFHDDYTYIYHLVEVLGPLPSIWEAKWRQLGKESPEAKVLSEEPNTPTNSLMAPD